MPYTQGICKILSKKELADGIYDFTLQNEAMAAAAMPGQFAHVLADGFALRRPISICGIDKENGTLRLIMEVRGEGTAVLAGEEDTLDLIAPIGNGFIMKDTTQPVILVGGGIGVPPLLEVSKAYKHNARAILGFRSKNAMILHEDFKSNQTEVKITTDDGTYGQKGFVTDVLQTQIEIQKPAIIYACGPMIMLKKVAQLAQSQDIPCQVSLEQRMGCGIGACLSCACQTIDRKGKEVYSHVCLNGPVFDSGKVVW